MMIHYSSVIVGTFSSFLTPDRLEKLNGIGFVWSVRGESSPSSSAAAAEKNATDALPDDKGESTTISVVDAVMAKPAGVQEGGEEAIMKEEKDDEGNAAAAAATAVDDESKDLVSVTV